MKMLQLKTIALPVIILYLFSCGPKINKVSYSGSVNTSGYQADTLAKPYETKSVKNFSKVVGWKEGQTPVAPEGFVVTKFADGFEHPRWIYVADNGDVFVAESNTILKGIKKIGSRLSRKIKTHHYGESANRIIRFTDADKDGIPETRSIYIDKELDQPFGMLIIGNYFYVANTDNLMQFDYDPKASSITTAGRSILTMPGQGRHWTKNIIANAKKDKIYIASGSASNVAEDGMDKEVRRAAILEINPDGSGEKIYASGLRNPVGMDWAPGTQTLWTAVNERDELGDELVPDYLTSVKEDGFYGWPYSYFGQHADPRMKGEGAELVKQAIEPDVALGSHTASLGLVFYDKNAFPGKYRNGAFITQHGSWNRSIISGYKVIFVPFKDGKPSGKPEDFLTGFINNLEKSEVYGRPVGIALLKDGSMLVSDDSSNTIWRVSVKK